MACVTLLSAEGEPFKTEVADIELSELVKTMLPDKMDEGEDVEIPLPKVSSEILKKVIDFCRYYRIDPMTEIEKPLTKNVMGELVQEWYATFVDVPQETLFDLIEAANYLDLRPLLDLTCATVGAMIKGKSPAQIRELFGITNDLSPEEEAQILEEQKWCAE